MTRTLPPIAAHEKLLPDWVRITPSNIHPWRGARREGDLFTGAQLGVMPLYKLDPEACEYIVVRSSIGQDEYWWPSTQRAPVYVCPCPIIQRRADGSQLLVVSPAGMKKWVYADGSITRPRAPRKGWGPGGRARSASGGSTQWG